MNLERLELFRQVIILLFLSLFSFIGVLLRNNLFGYDSYYVLTILNGFTEYGGHNTEALAVFQLLPHSIFIYHVFLWLCFFIGICGLYFGLKKAFDKDTAFLSLLVLLAGAPVLIFDFASFQNEALVYPFIFWSFYFLMAKRYILAFILPLIGSIFWSGALVWIAIIFPPILLLIFVGTFFSIEFFSKLFVSAFPNISGIDFNTYLWGLFDLFLLFPFIFGVFLDKKHKVWIVWTCTALICLALSARFVIIAIPFIGLGVGLLLPKLLELIGNQKTLIIACLFLILCWNVTIYLQHPTDFERNLEVRFVEDCKSGIKCVNDWGIGWQITSLGGVTEYKSSIPNPDYNNLPRPFLALTSNVLECNLINKQGSYNYFRCN